MIVIIGMRGAGKSTLSLIAKKTLENTISKKCCDVDIIDADEVLTNLVSMEKGKKCTISDLVAEEGWEKFREREKNVLSSFLTTESNTIQIFACGGGVVETPECRKLLELHKKTGGIVLEIHRDIRDIEYSLLHRPSQSSADTTSHRPAYAGSVTLVETWNRRREWYKQCSNATFSILYGDSDWSSIEEEFSAFFLRLVSPLLLSNGFVQVPMTNNTSLKNGSPWVNLSNENMQNIVFNELIEKKGTSLVEGKAFNDTSIINPPPPSTHFVCLTVKSIWMLLPEKDLFDAALSLGAKNESLTITSAASYLENQPMSTFGIKNDFCLDFSYIRINSPITKLADILYALTSGAGASAMELRVDLLLEEKMKESSTSETFLTSLEDKISYTLALLRRLFRIGIIRRMYKSVLALENVDIRPAAHNLPPLATILPPVIYTVRRKREGGVFDVDNEKLLQTILETNKGKQTSFIDNNMAYSWLVQTGLRFGTDCVDLELGRKWSESSTFDDSSVLLVQDAARAGATIIASAHWPGESNVPTALTLLDASSRCLEIIKRAATQKVQIHKQAEAMQIYRALSAIKLIGSGPNADLKNENILAEVIAKWVQSVASVEQSISTFWNELFSQYSSFCSISTPSLIALCMGATGKLTRVLNQHLTPVTHSILLDSPGGVAAPGQITASQIASTRLSMGLTKNHNCIALFGSPITLSPSPAMHNSAFSASSLRNWGYGRIDTKDAIEIQKSFLNNPQDQNSLPCVCEDGRQCLNMELVGANITIPLKNDALVFCTTLSTPARIIGAVNTLIQEGKEKIIGANTDWLGISRSISTRLLKNKTLSQVRNKIGLVVGAGGTAKAAIYALYILGFKIVIYNPRTPIRAIELANELHSAFGKLNTDTIVAMTDISSSDIFFTAIGEGILSVVISTLPPNASWEIPNWIFSNTKETIFFDVAYRPRTTFLSEKAQNCNFPTISGAEMLLHQGAAAWSMWMRRSEVTSSSITDANEISTAHPWGITPLLSLPAACIFCGPNNPSNIGVPIADMADAIYSAL
jgi:shikimate 5-dehydrogenase/shikimate kinase/3-dehydroquinate dehydratase